MGYLPKSFTWKTVIPTILVGVILFTVAESRAHHKVHNLALYPERHSWCQATPIRQEIAHSPECEPKVIDNMVCLGACFSYSVPRAQDYEPIAPYCDKCDKTFSSWTVITLNCTRESSREPYQLTRNVELISNCSCVDCNDNAARRSESAEEPEESLEDDLPDTLEGNYLHEHSVPEHGGGVRTGISPLRKLKSVSSELRELNEFNHKQLEEIMIKDNKIPSDDDDHDNVRN